MTEVRIKRLVWEEARVSDRWERFTAETIIGRYEALEWSNGGYGGSHPAEDKDASNVEFRAASINEAKAICWQHYQRCSMSVLDTAPATGSPQAISN